MYIGNPPQNRRQSDNNEILEISGALSGKVNYCYKLGINRLTGDLYYRDINDEWRLATSGGGGGGGSSAVLSFDLTVNVGSGQAVGGASTGDFFPQGTPLEDVLEAILVKNVHPTYTSPNYILSGTNQLLEAGFILNPTFTTTFIQNDAGVKTGERLLRNGGLISSILPYTDTSFQVLEGSNTYLAQVDYLAGGVKDNNFGVPDPVGRIFAGTKNSNTVVYTGYRKAFYQAITGSTPTNSAQVRALSSSLLNPAGQDFIINVPVGTVRVVFAIPATLTLQYVQYIELSNSDIKAAFMQNTVYVEGANGYAGISYKVYSFTPVEPFPVEVNYRVKAQ